MPQKFHDRPFAKRSLGQNFLVDEGVVRRILETFAAVDTDAVLEIGPGRGALTEGLVEMAGKLFVLEFDDLLADALSHRFGDRDNFTLIRGDALDIDFGSICPDRRLRLISNLPYNISTPILQRLFDYPHVFSDCLLMFQREVVDRITAKPGTKDRGYLTVLTEAHFWVEKLFDVPPDAFRPVPKVWSSVIRLTSLQPPHRSNDIFQRVVAADFAQKRKTIGNNLKREFSNYLAALSGAIIDPTRRAESLTLDEWLRLSEAVASGE